MLAEIRRALAEAVDAAVCRTVAYPPEKIDVPGDGLFAYVRGDAGQYLTAWSTFSTSGRAVVNLEVVLAAPATLGAERAHELIDGAIDPSSTDTTVFGAVMADQTLGITDFEVHATPHMGDVSAPQLEQYPTGESDLPILRYEVAIPVQVIARRS